MSSGLSGVKPQTIGASRGSSSGTTPLQIQTKVVPTDINSDYGHQNLKERQQKILWNLIDMEPFKANQTLRDDLDAVRGFKPISWWAFCFHPWMAGGVQMSQGGLERFAVQFKVTTLYPDDADSELKNEDVEKDNHGADGVKAVVSTVTVVMPLILGVAAPPMMVPVAIDASAFDSPWSDILEISYRVCVSIMFAWQCVQLRSQLECKLNWSVIWSEQLTSCGMCARSQRLDYQWQCIMFSPCFW